MSLRQIASELVPVMVGTAGHVDHGKTALTKLLTGCDTDRLREEKERGLSIDLGFAPYCPEGRGLAGLVDVPGHRDFIRNMVAGAASIDVLMLIVAADDGVMPQTSEHLRIVKHLRNPRVMVVITKIDLVDSDWLALVVSDVGQLLSQHGFHDAPVVCASNTTLEGIESVREALNALISQVRREPDARAFRMNVERVFSVPGHGTVVTGIPISGVAAIDNTLELLPAGSTHSLRGIQNYRHAATTAEAHVCTALNLRGLDKDAVSRGMTLVAPGCYRATRSVLAHFVNDSSSTVVKRPARVLIHVGTSTIPATAWWLDTGDVPPGSEAFAEFRFASPVVVVAGDRFILRLPSPSLTVGGGTILASAERRARRRKSVSLPERLRAAHEHAERREFLAAALLAGDDPVVAGSDACARAHSAPTSADAAFCGLRDRGLLLRVPGGWIVQPRLAELAASVQVQVRHFHRTHGVTWGMSPPQVAELVGLPAEAGLALNDILTGQAELTVRHGRLGMESFRPRLGPRQKRLRDAIVQAVEAGGKAAPAQGDLAKQTGADKNEVHAIVSLLIEEGVAVPLGTNLMLREAYEDCRRTLMALFRTNATVDIGAFRRTAGLGRNLAAQFLEMQDAEGITRRVGNVRELVRPTGCRTGS